MPSTTPIEKMQLEELRLAYATLLGLYDDQRMKYVRLLVFVEKLEERVSTLEKPFHNVAGIVLEVTDAAQ